MNRLFQERRARTLPASGKDLPFVVLVLLSVLPCQGCTSIMNPVANGVPVPLLPPELRAESKEGQVNLPLYRLRQPPPDEYRIGPDDILGIWIEGVLGEKGQAPVVGLSESKSPSLGFPIPVRKNGTISLPLVPPIKVEGLSLEEAENTIVKAYTIDRKILNPGKEKIIVTLQRPRQYHILVIRQDSATAGPNLAPTAVSATTFGIGVGIGSVGTSTKQGTGFAIDLPAYENDVLNALAKTGGFPGTDAVNQVLIYRGSFNNPENGADVLNALQNCPPGTNPLDSLTEGKQVVRIPLRARPGEFPSIKPEDVILKTGDIVFIEARNADVFYTGGFLTSGEYPLPRDADMDVVEAIARAHGPLLTSLSSSNLTGSFSQSGLGFPPPALVAVLRRTPSGDIVNIKVDLQRAMTDPEERLLIQSRDMIIMQFRLQDSIAQYFSNAVHLPMSYILAKGPRFFSTPTATFP
jgi:protein involved in polysaccharide export with SLBB domain